MPPLSRRQGAAAVASSDAELVAATRGGDATAFDSLVRRHLRRALAVATALLGSRPDAEDVVQDSFVIALERIDECQNPGRFEQWLVAIVRNRAHNARDYLERRRGEPIEHAPVASSGGDPATAAERAELRARLIAALDTLPRTQREVVILHDLEGWKHREIAALLGISETMSRQHLFVARRALRREIGAHVYSELRHD